MTTRELGGRFATPEAVEAAFYDAFERRDIDAMMAVWANQDGIVCIHPGGERLEGVAEVRSSWERIFASESPFAFIISGTRSTRCESLSVHLVKERIVVGGVTRGVMLASNVYQRFGNNWQLIVHHASPQPEGASVQATSPRKGLH